MGLWAEVFVTRSKIHFFHEQKIGGDTNLLISPGSLRVAWSIKALIFIQTLCVL